MNEAEMSKARISEADMIGDERPDGATLTRRQVLRGAGVLGGLAVSALALPPNLRRMLAMTGGTPAKGSLKDIEHIVILMQENRSFDEYLGTLPGVRGFHDTSIKLPSGESVFKQPAPWRPDGYLTPWAYDTKTTAAQSAYSLSHTWTSQHMAWNNGEMNGWIHAKGQQTMSYFTTEEIPFHTTLAEAFTVCDGYHCSVLGPTNPNRLYMWTGTIDPEGKAGGPVYNDAPAADDPYLRWTTYAERLEEAGISWQVYQENDNYDDNALAWFEQFAKASPGSPLYERGMTKRPAGWFEHDAVTGQLPQVSWLVAPSAQTEHPNYTPAAGAVYIASALDAIASNEDLWMKTAFILTYDENDGHFDHVTPLTPPEGTPDEFIFKAPIGLGFRVPTIVVSPWTVGGYVCSQTYDHTSLIRLLERRFGVEEPNISGWRRKTVGDLTEVFDFESASPFPAGHAALRVESTVDNLLVVEEQIARLPAPVAPLKNEAFPPAYADVRSFKQRA